MLYAKLTPDGSVAEIVDLKDEPVSVRIWDTGTPALVRFERAEPEQFDARTHRLSGYRDVLAGGKITRTPIVEEIPASEILARDTVAALSDLALAEIVGELLGALRKLQGLPPLTDEQLVAWLAERHRRSLRLQALLPKGAVADAIS